MIPKAVLLASCIMVMTTLVQSRSFEREVVEIINEDSSTIILSVTRPEAEFTRLQADGREYSVIRIPGEGNMSIPGLPELPSITRSVILPPGKAARLEIVADQAVKRNGVSEPALFEAELQGNSPRNTNFSGQVFPAEPAVLGKTGSFRGWKLQTITIYPFQYDYVNSEIIDHENIVIAVRFVDDGSPVSDGSRTQRPAGLTRDSYRFLNALALNPPHRDDDGERLPRGGYLIIVGNGLEDVAEIEELAQWKRATGHQVEVVPAGDDFNDPDEIKDNIITHAYENWDPPLEHVCLIGDYSRLHAFRQFDDVNFGLLDGNDHIAEVGVCRLSATNAGRVETVIRRAVQYQYEPYTNNMDWFTHAGAANERVSRYLESVRYTVKWIEEAAYRSGFDDVSVHYERENGASASNNISDWVRSGVNVVFVRGQNTRFNNSSFNTFNRINPLYIGASGHGERMWETMWNLGNSNNPVGPSVATCAYHNPVTLSCNVLIGGMARAMLIDKLPVGYARAFALQMLDYGESGNYGYYADYFGVYGDPGQVLWLGEPRRLEVGHRPSIALGQNLFSVSVMEEDTDDPVPNALVTLIDDEDLYIEGFTDETGECSLELDPEIEGELLLTVSGDGLIPYQDNIDTGADRTVVSFADADCNDDDGGNGDGVVNPGERIELCIEVANLSNRVTAENVVADLRSSSPWVTIAEHQLHFGDIRAGSSAEAEERVAVTIAVNTPDREDLRLFLDVQSDQGDWTSFVPLDIVGSRFEIIPEDADQQVDEHAESLRIRLRNTGRLRSERINARLASASLILTVIQGMTEYAPADPGGLMNQSGDDFEIFFNRSAVPGMKIGLELYAGLDIEEEIFDILRLELQFREPAEGCPQGPDNYGYVCFDDTDEAWLQRPVCSWIEINPREPDPDFFGDPLPGGRDEDFAEEIELPFAFRYYDEEFLDITVSENGFIAFGDGLEELRQFENFPLDRVMNGSFGMVAPYWDDLYAIGGERNIFTFYDEETDIFIIEWYQVPVKDTDRPNTFQVILYNPEVYGTPTGDGIIRFQYFTVAQPDNRNDPAYFSVGICSPDGKSGINYASDNQYPVTSAPITNNRAISFYPTARSVTSHMKGAVTRASDDQPLSRAAIYTNSGFATLTDNAGRWQMDVISTNVGVITARCETYLDSVVEYRIGLEDTLEINFSLLNPEFALDREEVNSQANWGDTLHENVTITNIGNGPMHFASSFDYLPEEMNRAPGRDDLWDIMLEIPVTAITRDSYVKGVEFFNGHFYITGNVHAVAGERHMIYVFNRDGRLVDELHQPCNDAWGFRGLTSDGEHLIGGESSEIVVIDPLTGEEIHRFLSPLDNNYALTYDPEAKILYTAVISEIVAVRFEMGVEDHEEIARYRLTSPFRPDETVRISGVAWFDDDPDGYQVYFMYPGQNILDDDADVYRLAKLDVNTGAILEVDSFSPGDADRGQPGGITITNRWDCNRIIVAYIDQNRNLEDFLVAREFAPNCSWITLDPAAGVLNSMENIAVELVLNTEKLWDAEFGILTRFYDVYTDRSVELPVILGVDSVVHAGHDPITVFRFEILGFHPNPVNSIGTLRFTTGFSDRVTLGIFDLLGRRVMERTVRGLEPGFVNIPVDMADFSAGIYFAVLETRGVREKIKIVVIK